MLERTRFWTKERDNFLRVNYGLHMRPDPALLAINLGCRMVQVVKRLQEMGLRHRSIHGTANHPK